MSNYRSNVRWLGIFIAITLVLLLLANYENTRVDVPAAVPTLQEKNVTITENGTTEIVAGSGNDGMSKVNVTVDVPSTGLSINGIIKEYKVNAGATVNAGDFVEFVTKLGQGEYSTQTCNYNISAVALSNTMVGVAHDKYFYVLMFADNQVEIYSTQYTTGSVNEVKALVLDKNRIFLFYKYYNSGHTLFYNLVTLSGEELIIGTEKSIEKAPTDYTYTYLNASKIEDNKLIISYLYYDQYEDNTEQNYTRIVKITEDEITVGSSNYISASCRHYGLQVVVLSTTKAIAFHIGSSLQSTHATIGVIFDNSVSWSSSSSVQIGTMTSGFKAVKLDENRCMIVYPYSSSSNYYLYCQIVKINDSTITKGTIVNIIGTSYFSYTCQYFDVIALDSNRVLISFYYGSSSANSYNGKCGVVTVDDMTITPTTSANLTTFVSSGITKDTSLVGFSDSSAMVFYYATTGQFRSLSIDGTTITLEELESNGTFVQPATSNLYNVGIAKTGGTEGETIEVYCVSPPSPLV